jgi:hypothetical protein
LVILVTQQRARRLLERVDDHFPRIDSRRPK